MVEKKVCPYNVQSLKYVMQHEYNDSGQETQTVYVETKIFMECSDRCGCYIDGRCNYKGMIE